MLDRFIAGMKADPDGDLSLCRANGVAFQTDRAFRVEYGADYFGKCASYEDGRIARLINRGRIAMVTRQIGQARVLDVGIGSGEFVRKRPNTFGVDVNPIAVEWLRARNLLARVLSDFAGYTFWDVIEHIPEPEEYFRHIRLHAFVFACLPIFRSLDAIRESKHYRPGEHLYYWTRRGFVDWMGLHGFRLVDARKFERSAGREAIDSFAFERWRHGS